MSIAPAPHPMSPRLTGLPLALRLALRDFRGGFSGFWIFLACLTLGLAAITGVGSVSRSLADGLMQKGRIILGGDLSFELVQREASAQELNFLAAQGRLSQIALMRAMARRADGQAALVEIKAVDAAYPAQGTLSLAPAQKLASVLAERDGVYGVAADPTLTARLDFHQGEEFKIGEQRFELRAILLSEPDKLAGAIGFGPRVLMSQSALRATGLLQPGALVKWLYRLSLLPGEQVDSVAAAARAAFPAAGFEIRTWKNVSPQFSRDLERFSQFLTLVGLSSLLIGGVGVANAVAGFVERKRETIATLKALGAPGGFVFMVMLAEVLAMAGIAMAAGVALGAALPFALEAAFGALIPFPLASSIFPREIAAGLLYGALTALAFSLAPLGRAHDVPVSALFRDEVAPAHVRPRRRYVIMLLAAACCLVLSVVMLAADRWLALIYLAAAIGGFVLLRAAAALIMAAARKFPHARHIELRLAIGNLHRPGALTPSILVSLGLGLALIVALAMIDGNLHHAFDRPRSEETPSYFFLGVASAEEQDFRSFLARHEPGAKLELVPMLRGRFVTIKGRPVDTLKVKDDVAWALEGDRGITFSATIPPGSTLAAGDWWHADYSGPPLVSLESEVADGLGLKPGDDITVNVLGRNITARVANLRKVDWRNLGINFVLVFSPNSFAGAPYSDLVTLTLATEAGPDAALVRDVAKAFPNVVSLRVKDALDAVKDIIDKLALAVRGAASIALFAATLVLGGALAAAQRSRLYDVVVLKTLGATRRRLVAAFLCEFGLIGMAAALFGVLVGGAAALAVVRSVMKLDFVWLWPQALAAAGAAFLAAVLLGLLGTWRILGQKPARYLRNL
ncbi:MAG TPA: FtsX-like permease family protein [Roseiarcus sp.]|nr:FtsX-like permease family protein [Roseiarcus sp.]